MQTIISSAVPAEIAERISDVDQVRSPVDEIAIEKRVDTILAERISHGDLSDVFDGLATHAFAPEIQRALRNLDAANSGDPFAESAIYQSLTLLRRTIKQEVDRLYRDDAREQAEREFDEGEAA